MSTNVPEHQGHVVPDVRILSEAIDVHVLLDIKKYQEFVKVWNLLCFR